MMVLVHDLQPSQPELCRGIAETTGATADCRVASFASQPELCRGTAETLKYAGSSPP